MFDRSKCDLCGDCLVECLYVNYDREKAVQEMIALIEDREAEILKECITCVACNEYCTKGANPFDLICRLQEKTKKRGTFMQCVLRSGLWVDGLITNPAS